MSYHSITDPRFNGYKPVTGQPRPGWTYRGARRNARTRDARSHSSVERSRGTTATTGRHILPNMSRRWLEHFEAWRGQYK